MKSDVELQAWWYEIINKGHSEKRDEPWWPSLNTKEDLTSILTTIIWVVSGYHAAISLGQNPAEGHLPKRPTFMRKLILNMDDPDYENFQTDLHSFFLSALPPPPAAPAPATPRPRALNETPGFPIYTFKFDRCICITELLKLLVY